MFVKTLLIGRELCVDEDIDCSFLVCPLNISEGEMDSGTSTYLRSTKSSSSSTEAWCCRWKLERPLVSSSFLMRTNRPDSGISSPPDVRKGMNLIPGQTDKQGSDAFFPTKLRSPSPVFDHLCFLKPHSQAAWERVCACVCVCVCVC